MLTWKKQGPAYTANLVLEGGLQASLVIVAGASNPNGAVLVIKEPSGESTTLSFPEATAKLRPGDIIELYCMQERAFGERAFPHPTV